MEVAARLPGAAPEQRPGALLPGAGEEVDGVGGEGQAEESELLLASLASIGSGEARGDFHSQGPEEGTPEERGSGLRPVNPCPCARLAERVGARITPKCRVGNLLQVGSDPAGAHGQG